MKSVWFAVVVLVAVGAEAQDTAKLDAALGELDALATAFPAFRERYTEYCASDRGRRSAVNEQKFVEAVRRSETFITRELNKTHKLLREDARVNSADKAEQCKGFAELEKITQLEYDAMYIRFTEQKMAVRIRIDRP